MRTERSWLKTLLKALIWLGDLVTVIYLLSELNRLYHALADQIFRRFAGSPDLATMLSTLLAGVMLGITVAALYGLDRWRKRMFARLQPRKESRTSDA